MIPYNPLTDPEIDAIIERLTRTIPNGRERRRKRNEDEDDADTDATEATPEADEPSNPE